ncbi:hypothetical protein ABEY69_00550 [Priestia filamentosa]|uniref:hypothetical protein n=1 Tax=Priestia filamentosa TaxID=1402861 RepID=UPI003D2E5B9A
MDINLEPEIKQSKKKGKQKKRIKNYNAPSKFYKKKGIFLIVLGLILGLSIIIILGLGNSKQTHINSLITYIVSIAGGFMSGSLTLWGVWLSNELTKEKDRQNGIADKILEVRKARQGVKNFTSNLKREINYGNMHKQDLREAYPLFLDTFEKSIYSYLDYIREEEAKIIEYSLKVDKEFYNKIDEFFLSQQSNLLSILQVRAESTAEKLDSYYKTSVSIDDINSKIKDIKNKIEKSSNENMRKQLEGQMEELKNELYYLKTKGNIDINLMNANYLVDFFNNFTKESNELLQYINDTLKHYEDQYKY